MMEAKKAELVKEMEELKAEYLNYNGADGEIGRALMEDQMEILSFTDWKFSEDATRAARDEEGAKVVG